MAEKTLAELQALHQRMETDVRRSLRMDPGGLTHFSPLVRNMRAVEEQIKSHPDRK
jgi:hypothetical protein